MTFVLNGGGDSAQSAKLDQAFVRELPRRTLLYVPHAVAPTPWTFERSLEWLKDHPPFAGLEITMWTELAGHSYGELDDFDAIYLMGGNTFVLLDVIRTSGFDALIDKFVRSKRVVHGISAGAIVLGKDIGTAGLGSEADENTPGIKDLKGLGLLGSYEIHTHYEDADAPAMRAYAARGPDPSRILCIPEDSGVIVRDTEATVIGSSPVTTFLGAEATSRAPGSEFNLNTATTSPAP